MARSAVPFGSEYTAVNACVVPVPEFGVSDTTVGEKTIVVESVAVAEDDPPPLTVALLTCGEVAFAGDVDRHGDRPVAQSGTQRVRSGAGRAHSAIPSRSRHRNQRFA